MAPGSVLHDGVVTLRPPDEGDLDGIDAGIHDPEVVRRLGSPPGTAAEILELNQRRATERSPTFAIRDDGDRFVGLAWINLSPTEPSKGSIGYWLLADARGHGLATRAVRLLVEHARRDLGLHRVLLVTELDNARSRAVAERAGFEQLATRSGSDEVDGRPIDVVVYSYPLEDPSSSSRSTISG